MRWLWRMWLAVMRSFRGGGSLGAIGHMDWKLGYGVWGLRFLQLFIHGELFDVEVVDDGLDDSCRHGVSLRNLYFQA